jgi:HEAT repeat protein
MKMFLLVTKLVLAIGIAWISGCSTGFAGPLQGSEEKSKQNEKAEVSQELKKTIEELIEKLGDEKHNVREAAQKELMKIGKPAVRQLEKACEEAEEPEVKRKAQDTLTCINWGVTYALLEKLPNIARELNVKPCTKIISELGKSGLEDAVVPLIKLFRDRTPVPGPRRSFRVGEMAANALIRMNQKAKQAATPYLARALKDKDDNVVSHAIHVIGLGWVGGVPLFIEALQVKPDKRFPGRYQIACNLGRTGDKRAIKPLIDALENKDERVRACAAEALNSITGQNFGSFSYVTSEQERSKAVKKWKSWWEKNKRDFEQSKEKQSKEKQSQEIKNKEVVQRGKPELPAELKQQVDNLIRKLGARKYAERDAAYKELANLLQNIKTFDALFPYLKQRTVAARDLEVKVRLERITGQYREFGITSSLLEKFPGITARLTSRDKRVRLGVLKELGNSNHPDAVKPLAKMLDDPAPGVRREAISTLGKLGAMEALIRALDNADREVRWHAVNFLGKTKNAGVVEPLIKVLGDGEPEVRRKAVKVLGGIKDARVVEPLIKALGDPDHDVCRQAAYTLGDIKDTKAVKPLVELLLGNADYSVRYAAAGALGDINDTKAVEPLIKALNDPVAGVRGRAAGALGELGDARAVEPLIKMLGDEIPGVRWAAAIPLGELGDARAVEPLIKALSDKNPSVRLYVAEALGAIKDAKAVEPLTKALDDADKTVRRYAADALAAIKKPIKEEKSSNEKMDKLVSQLGGKKAGDIEAAQKELTKIGLPALPKLTKAMRSADGNLAKTASQVVDTITKNLAPSIETLVKNLGAEKHLTREDAYKQLKKIGWPALPAIRKALESKDPEVSSRVKKLIKEIGESSAVSKEEAIRIARRKIFETYRRITLPLSIEAKLIEGQWHIKYSDDGARIARSGTMVIDANSGKILKHKIIPGR